MAETKIEFANAPMPLGQKILLQMKTMEDIRRDYEIGLWEDISRFVNPRRENIRSGSEYNLKGQRRGKDAYDGTPNSALGVWRDGMQGFLVSESLNWFRSEMDNPYLNDNDNVRTFLQDYDLGMYSAYRRGNYYAVQSEWFGDAGSIGTATLYTEEDIKEGKSVHTVVHPREVFIAENKYGEVDTEYRKFMMTARQMVQKFTYEKLSAKAKNDARNNPHEESELIHAVFPNDEMVFGKMTNRGKPTRSVYIELKLSGLEGIGHLLRDSGYRIDPYAVWRFRKNSDEIYGYSPAADAIIEIFGLQQFGKTMMEAAQKSVDPSLNIPEEQRGQVRITPHGYNYYQDPKRVITPILTGINYPIGVEQQNRLRDLLEDKYRVNYFQMLTRMSAGKQRKTAEEIIAMKSEVAVLLGPQVDRLYNEGIKKHFDIVSDIEDRAGRLPNPDDYNLPDEFYEGGRININLTGPLAQAQRRLFRMQPIQNTLNELAPAAAVLGPEIMDVVNKDELSEMIVEAGAFPQKAINSREERKRIREQRAADAAAAQQKQDLLEAAKVAPNLGKSVEKDSILEKVGV